MAISPARRRFRHFLYGLLFISILFTGTMAYYRMSFQRTISIAPDLISFDVMQLNLRAQFMNNPDKYATALKMYGYQISSYKYGQASRVLMNDLVDDGYAPAQTFKAHYILRFARINSYDDAPEQARALFTLAAAQNHKPAIEALHQLDLARAEANR